jgi:hypothetical protein
MYYVKNKDGIHRFTCSIDRNSWDIIALLESKLDQDGRTYLTAMHAAGGTHQRHIGSYSENSAVGATSAAPGRSCQKKTHQTRSNQSRHNPTSQAPLFDQYRNITQDDASRNVSDVAMPSSPARGTR